MKLTKARIWRATHCALFAFGCVICWTIYPVVLIVRGVAILEMAAERRERLALSKEKT